MPRRVDPLLQRTAAGAAVGNLLSLPAFLFIDSSQLERVEDDACDKCTRQMCRVSCGGESGMKVCHE